MKATKKIVGATAALVAALALSAGSTFAWFSGNTSVSAEGMKVQVVVPTNLYIAKGHQTDLDNITGVSIDYEELTANKLEPAKVSQNSTTQTQLDVEIPKTWTTEPTTGTAGEAATYDTVGTVTAAGGGVNGDSATVTNYVAIYQMTVVMKADDPSKTYGLDAKVDISGIADDTSNTYFKCGFISSEGVWAMQDGDLSVTSEAATVNIANVATGINCNTPVSFAFVVWYDGTDNDCYSNNAANVAAFSIDITFTQAAGN